MLSVYVMNSSCTYTYGLCAILRLRVTRARRVAAVFAGDFGQLKKKKTRYYHYFLHAWRCVSFYCVDSVFKSSFNAVRRNIEQILNIYMLYMCVYTALYVQARECCITNGHRTSKDGSRVEGRKKFAHRTAFDRAKYDERR